MRIVDVHVGDRHRKTMGDLDGLARSIAEIGLLHPIVVTPDGRLIAGERRLRACQRLGWDDIPATVVDLENLVLGERDENMQRRDFTPTEMVDLGRALEPIEREAGKERQGTRNDLPLRGDSTRSQGKSLDRVAKAVGVSRPTYEKATAVVKAAEEDPVRFGDLPLKMDESSVERAFKEMKARERKAERDAALVDARALEADDRVTLFVADIRACPLAAGSVDLIITDPPYPKDYLYTYGALAETAARILAPGGSLLAMCGQTYLPDVMAAMTPHLTYNWTLAYLTPGGQAVQVWPRKVNAFWKPVVWFVKGEYSGDWLGDVCRSAVNDNDKAHHSWGQSESGMHDLMRRIVQPGNTVYDPFCGGGTTGIVALELGARFIGSDADTGAVDTTRTRIGASLCK